MVCGSIGYGGVEEIREFYSNIRNAGFEILDHVEDKDMDYSNIKDFRDKRKLSEDIVSHDLNYVAKADVLVVILNKPSYGTAIEMEMAKKAGKTIVLYAPNPIPTPWPFHFSDHIIKNKEDLIDFLKNLDKQM